MKLFMKGIITTGAVIVGIIFIGLIKLIIDSIGVDIPVWAGIFLIFIAAVFLLLLIGLPIVLIKEMKHKKFMSKFSDEDFFKNKETKEWINKIIEEMKADFMLSYKNVKETTNLKEKYEMYTDSNMHNRGINYFYKEEIEKRIKKSLYNKKLTEICTQNDDFKHYPSLIIDAYYDSEMMNYGLYEMKFDNIEFNVSEIGGFFYYNNLYKENPEKKDKQLEKIRIKANDIDNVVEYFVTEKGKRIENYINHLNKFNNHYQSSF